MRMSFSVAVAGASGYAGGEVLRLLAGHPDAQVKTVTASSDQVGDKLIQHQLHLLRYADLTLEPTNLDTLAGHDVVVVGLPHGASAALTEQLEHLKPSPLVMDLGADHRLISPQDWADYYGGPAAAPWTYGMPELLTGWDQTNPPKQRTNLPGANRVAVPGCNATAVTLALAPGIASGWLSPTDLVAVLACGVSGAGKAYKPHLMAAELIGQASPYAVGGSHRHIPEIKQNLLGAMAPGSPGDLTLSFTPTLAPMTRGILATVTAKPGPNFDPDQLTWPWQVAYADEPFVHLLEAGSWPGTAQTLGANTATIQLAYDHRAGRVIVVSALDNLVKGTAGACVQSINLALGLPETTGLTQMGVAP